MLAGTDLAIAVVGIVFGMVATPAALFAFILWKMDR